MMSGRLFKNLISAEKIRSVCVFVCVSVCVFLCMFECQYLYVCMHMRVCKSVSVCLYLLEHSYNLI